MDAVVEFFEIAMPWLLAENYIITRKREKLQYETLESSQECARDRDGGRKYEEDGKWKFKIDKKTQKLKFKIPLKKTKLNNSVRLSVAAF